MAIAHNNSSNAGSASTASLSWSHTCSGTDRFLIVGISTPTVAATGVTFNGVAMTRLDQGDLGTGPIHGELWYLIAPAATTANIVVTLAGATAIAAGASSYTGVHQTAPYGAHSKTTGDSVTATNTVTSATGELVHDCLALRTGLTTITVGAGQTQRWNRLAAAVTLPIAAGSSEAGAASVTMSWTVDDATPKKYVSIAVPLRPSGTGYAFTVAGVSKELQPKWSVRESMNTLAQLSGEVLSLDGSYRPAMDASVVLTEDGVRIFGGFLDAPAERGFGGVGGTAIVNRIQGVDCTVLATRRTVNETVAAGTTLRAALTTLRTNYLNSFGTSTNIYIDGSLVSTGPALPQLTYEDARLDAVFSELAAIAEMGWEIDYSNQLRYATPGSNPAPFDVIDGDGNALGDILVERTREDYGNRVTVLAGEGTESKTQSFTADGSDTSWATDLPATNDEVSFELNGAPVPIGPYAPGDTANLFAYQWDPATHTIYQRAGDAAATVGTTLEVTYIAQYPFRHVVNDAVEQGLRGVWEPSTGAISAPSARTAEAAEAIGQAFLAGRVLERTKVTYVTAQKGIRRGMTQTITIADRDVDGTFLIMDVEIYHVEGTMVRRRVTAIESTVYPGSWREQLSGSSVGSTGTVVPPMLTGANIRRLTSDLEVGGPDDLDIAAFLRGTLSSGMDAQGPAVELAAANGDAMAIVVQTAVGGPQMKFLDLTAGGLALSYIMRLYFNAASRFALAPSVAMNAAAGVDLGSDATGERWGNVFAEAMRAATARLTGTATPAQITANQNNYSPTDWATRTHSRISSDAARDITGLAALPDGTLRLISNGGAFAITLKNNSASSSVGNRIVGANAADVVIRPNNGSVWVRYDANVSSGIWFVVGA